MPLQTNKVVSSLRGITFLSVINGNPNSSNRRWMTSIGLNAISFRYPPMRQNMLRTFTRALSIPDLPSRFGSSAKNLETKPCSRSMSQSPIILDLAANLNFRQLPIGSYCKEGVLAPTKQASSTSHRVVQCIDYTNDPARPSLTADPRTSAETR